MPENPVRTRRTALHLLRTMHDALNLVESGLDTLAPRGDPEATDLIVALRMRVNSAFADLEAMVQDGASYASEGESAV